MKIALCNEVIADRPFPAQCELAAKLGYDALEIAPFTLAAEPHLIAASARQGVRRATTEAGLWISSLHWLLVAPEGLSITSADAAVRAQTIDVARRLIALAADLGADVLVHGSPVQRQVVEAGDAERGKAFFLEIAEAAADAGVTYCIEPLAGRETNFINCVADAAAIVEEADNPALRTMVDCAAASLDEDLPVDALLRRWLPTGMIAHVQVNDQSRLGPGQGNDRFAGVVGALTSHGYSGVVAVEPFDYSPDGAGSAARAIGYLRGLEEGMSWSS